MDGDYDTIVVGAGSAGCVVANRLSADPARRVLLLEAGGLDRWVWFHIPVGYLFAIGNPRADWMYQTEPEPGLNGRVLNYPRGRVIGGSSAINAMVSMRGQAQDYDGWRDLGLPGWGWDDVRPVFRQLDSHFGGETEHHGSSGEWRVEAARLRWDVLDAVAAAAVQMGIPQTEDFNTGDNTGVGYFHVNQKRGRRWSAARGFLKPVLVRANLRLETGVLVDRVIFEGTRAVGVRYVQGGAVREVRARQVVLCAGAVNTPVLLQRSGIGPAEWLAEAGVPVVLHRPGVGRNLQDHLQQRAIYRVFGIGTLNERYHSLPRRAWMGLEYALRRTGPLTMAPSQLGIFTASSAAHAGRPNIQFHVQPLSLDRFGAPLHRFAAITVAACNLQPTSRGTIRLRSAAAADSPVIAPGYLATEADRQVASDAIRVTRRLMRQAALAPYRPEEYLPGPGVGDDAEALAKAAGDIGTTIFHPVGTARMGVASDAQAVVDARLRVIGVEGLRVVDASVMPVITSGNTNTPTIMIAEKGARMMIEDEAGT